MENGNQTPKMDHRERNIVEQKTGNYPNPRVLGATVWVAAIIIDEGISNANTNIVPVEVGKAFSGDQIVENIGESQERSGLSLDSSPEKEWVSNKIELGLLEGFNVTGSAPADLLHDPATHCGWGICCCQCVRRVGHGPSSHEKVCGEVAILVDNLSYDVKKLHVNDEKQEKRHTIRWPRTV